MAHHGEAFAALAKLTGMVNIAVFAVFHIVIGNAPRLNAAFKPVCRDGPLDVSCYGWQKRQDRGKNGKGRGTILTDSGTIWRIQGTVTRDGWAGAAWFRLSMWLFRCLRRRVAPG